jgi:protein O-mannosyl-transferase
VKEETAGLRRFLLPAAIFAITFVTFLPGLSGEFLNWDDDVNFLGNPNFRGLGWENVRWMFTTTHEGHWIPLTWLTLGLNYALGGMNPLGYHVGSLLFHASCAVLFYFAARRLIGAALPVAAPGALSWGAAFAALLFAVHPLRVESVVWITERRDVQSMFFYLLAALGYLRAVEESRNGRLSSRWRALSVAAFVCAVVSKSSTIMLPAALFLIDLYPLRRASLGWRRLIVEKLPYLIVAAADVVVALIAVRSAAKLTGLGTHGLAGRIAIVFYSFFYYPWKLVWPVELSPMYEMPQRVGPLEPRFLVAITVVVLVTAVLVALRRRWPAGLCAWVYSAVMILPLSGVIHAGFQLVQDRWSYLSGMGFVLLAGGGAAWLLDARARGRVSPVIARSVMAGAVAVVVLLAIGSWDQSKVWHDSETLWRWGANMDPECTVCWNNLGTALIGHKRYAEAEDAYRRIARLRPMSAQLANNLATAIAGQGKTAEAAEMLRLALRIDPDLTGAQLNLGLYEAQTGRFDEALGHLRKAYARDPKFPGAAKELGKTLVLAAAHEVQGGRPDQAGALYREALSVQPGDVQAQAGLQALGAPPSAAPAGPAASTPASTPKR